MCEMSRQGCTEGNLHKSTVDCFGGSPPMDRNVFVSYVADNRHRRAPKERACDEVDRYGRSETTARRFRRDRHGRGTRRRTGGGPAEPTGVRSGADRSPGRQNQYDMTWADWTDIPGTRWNDPDARPPSPTTAGSTTRPSTPVRTPARRTSGSTRPIACTSTSSTSSATTASAPTPSPCVPSTVPDRNDVVSG